MLEKANLGEYRGGMQFRLSKNCLCARAAFSNVSTSQFAAIDDHGNSTGAELECQACFGLFPKDEMVHNKGCGHCTMCQTCFLDMLKSNLDDYTLRMSIGMIPECPEEGCHEPASNVAAMLAKEPQYYAIFEKCLVS